MSQHIEINLVPGDVAPRYDTGYEIDCSHVTITEKGTKDGLPLVDFVARDRHGEKIMFVLTGRLVNMISASIKGVNLRNHGTEEP